MPTLRMIRWFDQYRHIMIDLETTGLNPGINRITSVALHEFDPCQDPIFAKNNSPLMHCLVGPDPRLLRSDNMDTMKFRETSGINMMEEQLMESYSPQVAVQAMLHAFRPSADDSRPAIVWAKPTKFDVAFVESYCAVMGLEVPWHHRNTIDMNSFIAGLGLDPYDVAKDVIKIWQFDASRMHDASYDCQYQIATVQYALGLADKLAEND